ncbi:MAG: lysoplasmalogenase [Desulfomonilaceae bacterium]
MVNVAILAIALGLLAGLLVAENQRRSGLILTFKTPLSALFVAVAVIQPHPILSYYHWILAGLVLGLIGDVCLALKGDRAFKAGLISFLLGHIMYVVAFLGLTRPSDWLTLGLVLIVLFSLGAFLWLRPHLGAMIVPVVMYIIVITIMLVAAWVAFLNPEMNWRGSWSIFLGALCFYVSDLFVARDRFVKSQFVNPLLGLPLYYGGQFLIAFSVGLV